LFLRGGNAVLSGERKGDDRGYLKGVGSLHSLKEEVLLHECTRRRKGEGVL